MADINSSLPVSDTSDATTGSAVPTMAQQMGGTDGTNLRAISVDSTGKVNINNISGTISIPTGAATSALQTTGNSSLSSIATTSNSTATNTASIITNQTNGTQKVQITDAAGSLFQVTKIDTGNSTSANLGIGAVFTGAWTDVSNYSTVSIIIFANQVSATDGFVIQQSSDATNVDDNDVYTIPASSGQQFSVALVGRYYRIVYTNGGVAQTAFRMQAKIHTNMPKQSSVRVADGVGRESDAQAVINVNGRMPLTASAPTTVSAGTSTGTLIAANTARKGLVVINTSSLGTISLNIVNGSAVLNSGITLYPHDVWYMDEWTFTTSQINVIASLAATSVAIQELT